MTTLYNTNDNPKASQFWIYLSLILWCWVNSTSVHLSKKGFFFSCQAVLMMEDGLFCPGSQQLHHKYFRFWGPCAFPFASQYEEPHLFSRCSPPASLSSSSTSSIYSAWEADWSSKEKMEASSSPPRFLLHCYPSSPKTNKQPKLNPHAHL